MFASTEKQLQSAISQKPVGIVTGEKAIDYAQDAGFKGNLYTSPAVSLALAKIGFQFFNVVTEKTAFDGHKIHPSAVVSDSAELHESVVVGPNTTIGPGCKLSENVVVGANCTLEANCTLGEGTYLRSQVFIGQGTIIGKSCEIHPQAAIATEGFGYAQDQEFNHHHIPHYGNAILEDRVHIGAGVTLDRGTFGSSLIGAGTIIDNQCHFGHNFVCGKKCIFTGGIVVAGSVTIGDACVLGGRTTISGHLKITSQVRLAGLSGVTKDITEPGEYGGYPLQPLKDSLRSLSTLPHLPAMRKSLKSLEKQN